MFPTEPWQRDYVLKHTIPGSWNWTGWRDSTILFLYFFIYISALDCDVIYSVKRPFVASFSYNAPVTWPSPACTPVPHLPHQPPTLYTCRIQNCNIIYCGIGPGFVFCLWSCVCSPFGLYCLFFTCFWIKTKKTVFNFTCSAFASCFGDYGTNKNNNNKNLH